MSININLSTIQSEKQTKQRRTETESWIQNVLMVVSRKAGGGEWYRGEGIKKYKYVLTA